MTLPLYGFVLSVNIEYRSDDPGTERFYSGDQYNEMKPKRREPSYLRAASGAVWNIPGGY